MKAILALFLCCPLLAKDAPKEYPLTLNVLQSKQTPFRHGASNSSQTNCRIIGDNINCDTYDTSFQGIPGVSFLMLATASDGNTYMFGCDAEWRWSHCDGLMVGKYSARFDKGRLAVSATFGKKQREVKYHIFQVEVTQK